jgi:pimeloyl-ACP methyl ester carboxylesterase
MHGMWMESFPETATRIFVAQFFMEGKHVTRITPNHLDASDTTYVDLGNGQPVVFIHGSLADYRAWEHQHEMVARSYRFIALNLRYHGSEQWPDGETAYSVLDHAKQVIEFIRELNIGKVHLVGHSYGAEVAMYVALEAQDMLCSLVLNEPPGDFLVTGPDAAAVIEERKRVFAPARAAANAGQLKEAAQLLINAVINRGEDVWQKASEASRAMMLENARTLPLLFSAPPPPPLSCDQLKQITLPALVINGEETTEYFQRIGQRVMECMPGCKRIVIQHTTHAAQDQDAETYNRVLLDFLAQAR